MVNQFKIKDIMFREMPGYRAPLQDLLDKIENSCEGYGTVNCWRLKDAFHKGDMYVPRKFFVDNRGRRVQMRQLLFQVVFRMPVPVGQLIKMGCGESICINPGHYTVKGWMPQPEILQQMIGNWLTPKRALEIHGYVCESTTVDEPIGGHI